LCSCFVSSASIFLRPKLFLDLLLPVIPCHLFVGSHCYCYSSDKRLRLLLPGLGLAACPPLVVDLLLRFPCCSILGSCHPALVVLVASKFNRSLVWGTRTNSACKRSGRCYADIRLLFLDAYYCQSIARDSVPSARLGFPVSLPSTTVAAAVLAPPRQHAAPPPGLYPGSRPTPRRFASRASWARLGSLEPPHQSPRRPSCARAGRARRYAAVLRL